MAIVYKIKIEQYSVTVKVTGRGSTSEKRVNEMVAKEFEHRFGFEMAVRVPGDEGHLTSCPWYVRPENWIEDPDAIPFVVVDGDYAIRDLAKDARSEGGARMMVCWNNDVPENKQKFELYQAKGK